MPWLRVIFQFYPAHQPQHVWVISGSKTSSFFFHSLSGFLQPSTLSLFAKSLSPAISHLADPATLGFVLSLHCTPLAAYPQDTIFIIPYPKWFQLSWGPRALLISSSVTSISCQCSLTSYYTPAHAASPSWRACTLLQGMPASSLPLTAAHSVPLLAIPFLFPLTIQSVTPFSPAQAPPYPRACPQLLLSTWKCVFSATLWHLWHQVSGNCGTQVRILLSLFLEY